MPVPNAPRHPTNVTDRERADLVLAYKYPDHYHPAGDWLSHQERGYMPIPERNRHGRTREEQARVASFWHALLLGALAAFAVLLIHYLKL